MPVELGSDDVVMSCAHMHTYTHTLAQIPCVALCSCFSRVRCDLPQREVMSHCMMSYLASNQESTNGLCLCKSADGTRKKNRCPTLEIDLDVQHGSRENDFPFYALFFVLQLR